MRIQSLSLTNFRNYLRLEASFPEGAILLAGPNAQGKTSLLEAIYLFTHARSPLAESDRQLINFLAQREPQPFARLLAEATGVEGEIRIEVRLFFEPPASGGEPTFHKEILVNGSRRKPSELPGHLHALLFLPHELKVVEGAPADRRRHLDETLTQADPHYRAALWEYHRVLTQRNALLRSLQEQGGDSGQLDFWDEQLAAHGAVVILGRMRAVDELERQADPIHRRLTHNAENLQLLYRPSFDPARPDGVDSAAAQRTLPIEVPLDRSRCAPDATRKDFLAALRRERIASIRRGTTVSGPHRDELRFLANGIDLTVYGSRGQARTALLSLKLAEVEWMRTRTGQWPVLLLDEVLSELDMRRRADLLDNLAGADQVILTASDTGMLPDAFRERAHLWWVEGGTVRPG